MKCLREDLKFIGLPDSTCPGCYKNKVHLVIDACFKLSKKATKADDCRQPLEHGYFFSEKEMKEFMTTCNSSYKPCVSLSTFRRLYLNSLTSSILDHLYLIVSCVLHQNDCHDFDAGKNLNRQTKNMDIAALMSLLCKHGWLFKALNIPDSEK